MSASPRAVHLLPAAEVVRQGYGSMPVAVCGDLVTGEPDGEDDPRYCAACVRAAVRWSVEAGMAFRPPGAVVEIGSLPTGVQ